MYGFSTWMLEDPRALGLLLATGYTLSVLIFGTLAGLMFYHFGFGYMSVIFSLFTLLTAYKLYGLVIAVRRVGGAENLFDKSMQDIFFRGDKSDKHTNDTESDEHNEGRDRGTKERIRQASRESKSDDHSFLSLIQEPSNAQQESQGDR